MNSVVSLNDNSGSNKPNAHLNYIDNAKGLGMIMIVMGHMSYLGEPLFTICSSIKILIFYIVSGHLSAYKQDNNRNVVSVKKYVSKKAKALGIPYVFYSLCALAVDLLCTIVTHSDSLKVLRTDAVNTLIMRGISTLWFLPTLFLADILFAVSQKAVRKIGYPLLAVFPFINLILCNFYKNTFYQKGVGFLPSSGIFCVILKSITAYVFVIYGYVIYNALKKLQTKSYAWIIAMFVGVVTVILTLLNKGVDFNNYICGRYPVLYIINGYLFGALIMFLLMKCEGVIKLRVLSFIGANTLFIMATHLPWKLSIVLKWVVRKLYTAEQADVGYYLILILSTAVMLLIEYPMIKFKAAVVSRCKKYEKLYDVLKYI